MLKVLEAVPFQIDTRAGVAALRQQFRDLPRQPVYPEVLSEDRTVDGPAGPVPVRLYRPPHSADRRLPVVVFLHGGGWTFGDLDSYDGTAREHAALADALVVSVEYRLAPEHPYPAAVQDCWAAVQWAAAHADEVGGDPTRIAVAGDSAGGNLSAVMALLDRDHARDNGSAPALRYQLLWYPATTWDTSLPSFTENADAPLLGLDAVAGLSRWYAGHVDLADPPPTLVPARAADLSGLPPAYIAVAGHDPLRDDGVRYAELLTAAGVPAELHHAETLMHGYIAYSGVVPAATAATERGLTALKTALHDPDPAR